MSGAQQWVSSRKTYDSKVKFSSPLREVISAHDLEVISQSLNEYSDSDIDSQEGGIQQQDFEMELSNFVKNNTCVSDDSSTSDKWSWSQSDLEVESSFENNAAENSDGDSDYESMITSSTTSTLDNNSIGLQRKAVNDATLRLMSYVNEEEHTETDNFAFSLIESILKKNSRGAGLFHIAHSRERYEVLRNKDRENDRNEHLDIMENYREDFIEILDSIHESTQKKIDIILKNESDLDYIKENIENIEREKFHKIEHLRILNEQITDLSCKLFVAKMERTERNIQVVELVSLNTGLMLALDVEELRMATDNKTGYARRKAIKRSIIRIISQYMNMKIRKLDDSLTIATDTFRSIQNRLRELNDEKEDLRDELI